VNSSILNDKTTALPLAALAEDWLTALEAEGKSKHTLVAYRGGVSAFLAWHARQADADPVLDKAAASAFLKDLQLAHTEPLWLSASGRRTFQYAGLSLALAARAKAAGIERFHLHRLRHTGASRWLAAGGSEQGLMAALCAATRSASASR
jgi:site-specific recombinase XerD